MTNAAARVCAVSSAALLLGFAAPDSRASDRVRSSATMSIQGSAAVTVINTVVNNAPMQTMLLTAAIAPVSVLTPPSPNSGTGLLAVGNSGATGSGTGASGAQSSSGAANAQSPIGTTGAGDTGNGAAGFSEGGSPAGDGSGLPALIVVGGSLNGTTIDGDAISINVGDVSGGTTADSARVPVVIAQYN